MNCQFCGMPNSSTLDVCRFCGNPLQKNSVKFRPGEESEKIKVYINYLFNDIHAKFPNGIITKGDWNHERWDDLVEKLSKYLGYKDGEDFLRAYGFKIIDTMPKKYTKSILDNELKPQCMKYGTSNPVTMQHSTKQYVSKKGTEKYPKKYSSRALKKIIPALMILLAAAGIFSIALPRANDAIVSFSEKKSTNRTTESDISSFLAASNSTTTKISANSLEIGDSVFFGRYEQDNDLTNGKEDIEWIVLDKKDDKALLISKYSLDCKQYNTYQVDVTWEECTLRHWLNEDFFNNTFTSLEQDIIAKTEIVNTDNVNYGTKGGNNTLDKVFLLSLDEAEKYFPSDDARRCATTVYAYEQGAWISNNFKTTEGKSSHWWRLRSPGASQHSAVSILNDGSFYYNSLVFIDRSPVRPAIWISTRSNSNLIKKGINSSNNKPKTSNALEIGNSYYFGTYEQDNDTSNGKEKIEWIALDKKHGKTLLISKYALDYKRYNSERIDITWEECSLRKWLNEEFLNNAFTSAEQNQIAKTKVINEDNHDDGVKGGNDTLDKVFLLSIDEVERYFSTNIEMKCAVTESVFVQDDNVRNFLGEYGEADEGWWLRSPKLTQDTVATVNFRGLQSNDNCNLLNAVRPAMWINLNS